MKKANKAQPEVEIEFGGETHSVVCDFRTLCRFQRATGLNPLDMSLWTSPSPVLITGFIWAALSGKVKGLTLEKVEEIMTFDDLSALRGIIQALFQNASAEIAEGTEEKKVE